MTYPNDFPISIVQVRGLELSRSSSDVRCVAPEDEVRMAKQKGWGSQWVIGRGVSKWGINMKCEYYMMMIIFIYYHYYNIIIYYYYYLFIIYYL